MTEWRADGRDTLGSHITPDLGRHPSGRPTAPSVLCRRDGGPSQLRPPLRGAVAPSVVYSKHETTRAAATIYGACMTGSWTTQTDAARREWRHHESDSVPGGVLCLVRPSAAHVVNAGDGSFFSACLSQTSCSRQLHSTTPNHNTSSNGIRLDGLSISFAAFGIVNK